MQILAVVLSLSLLAAPLPAGQDDLNKQLYDAVLFNDPAAITALHAKGADVNHEVNGRSLLSWAAQRGNAGVVQALLAGGADPNAVDNMGYTPLMRAIKTRQVDAVQLLLDSGADPGKGDVQGTSVVSITWL